MPTREELKMLQALPLDIKIRKTQQRIREWVEYYGEDGVYVSFSGEKDSAVLLDIVRSIYPKIEAVFVNTGLEYPEIVEFVKQHENVTILKPKKNFREILTEYGYPIASKEVAGYIDEARNSKSERLRQSRIERLQGRYLRRDGKKSEFNREKWGFALSAPFRISDKCCNLMKKNPIYKFAKENEKVAIMGTMAEESKLRKQKWIKSGCNAFDSKHPNSAPLSFWTNNDILTYIHKNNLPIASVYGDVVPDDKCQILGQENIYDLINDYTGCKFKTTGCDRTGCMFCLFGAHIEKGEGRLERMKHTHPKRYEYVMGGGKFDSDGMWIPDNKGLGFKFVVDWINENGNLNIKY